MVIDYHLDLLGKLEDIKNQAFLTEVNISSYLKQNKHKRM